MTGILSYDSIPIDGREYTIGTDGSASPQEVCDFLAALMTAMEYGRFHLKDREKNLQSLADLGLSINDMKAILRRLSVENYSAGPKPDDTDETREVWIFGYAVEGKEIYIKLRLAPAPGKRHVLAAVVWSFHQAEFPMKYPFRGDAK